MIRFPQLLLAYIFKHSSGSSTLSYASSSTQRFISIPYIMHVSILLAVAPAAVLGCLNANSNPCASFIKSQVATASPFCASFTRTVVTATTGLPAWAANCSNKPNLISAECSCHYTGGSSPITTTSPVRTTAPATTTAGQATTTRGTTPTTTAGGGNSGSCNAPVCSS